MIVQTRDFGSIDIDDKKIITFKNGLLGFEHLKEYVVILNEEDDVPFHTLQSIEDPHIAFIIVDPFRFKKDYAIDCSDQVIKELNLQKEEDVIIYTIAVIPKDIKNMTINLKGPLVINRKNRLGKQCIIDHEEYETKYYIFKQGEID